VNDEQNQSTETSTATTTQQPEEPVSPVASTPTPDLATTPATPVVPVADTSQHSTSPGLLILQWLTYAFWGWTILALSVLTTTVYSSLINKEDVGGFVPYGVAAVLVLLPISFICDSFLVGKESEKKRGPEIIIMVIHAVIFALFGIGSLIVATIALVILFTSSGESRGALVSLASALTVAVFYLLTFVRTLRPKILWNFATWFRFIMAATTAIIVILAFVGPVAQERATKTDRLIEDNMYQVNTAIQNYVNDNKELPDNLGQLTLSGEGPKKLVDDNIVTYKPEGVYTDNSTYSDNSSFKYQLCVNYTQKDGGYDSSNRYDGEYSSYVDTSGHPAGNVCYKLYTY
jgi:uncharacterized membrane protein YqjE